MYENLPLEQRKLIIAMKEQFITVLSIEYKLSSLRRKKKEWSILYEKYLIELNKYNAMVKKYNNNYEDKHNLHNPIKDIRKPKINGGLK